MSQSGRFRRFASGLKFLTGETVVPISVILFASTRGGLFGDHVIKINDIRKNVEITNFVFFDRVTHTYGCDGSKSGTISHTEYSIRPVRVSRDIGWHISLSLNDSNKTK